MIQSSNPWSSRATLERHRSVQHCKLWCHTPLYHHPLHREKSNCLISYRNLLSNFSTSNHRLHVLLNLLFHITLGHLPALPLSPFPSLTPDTFGRPPTWTKNCITTNLKSNGEQQISSFLHHIMGLSSRRNNIVHKFYTFLSVRS